MERYPSVPRSKPLLTYGSSYKSGLRTRDSKSTLLGILRSGRNHTVGTTALHLLRAPPSLDSSRLHSLYIYRYFLEKNDEIRCGEATGVNINLKVLGIGDGLTVRCSDMSRQKIGY